MISFTFVSIAAKKKLQNCRDAMPRVSRIACLFRRDARHRVSRIAFLRVYQETRSIASLRVDQETRGKRREVGDARQETRSIASLLIHTNGKINAIVTPDLSSRLYKRQRPPLLHTSLAIMANPKPMP